MKISNILKDHNEGVCFEFFPPKSTAGEKSLRITVQALKTYQPLYASMTYGAGGGKQGKTQEAVSMLLKETKLVVMPHLTCIGLEKRRIKNLLDEYKETGIDNIMALRGDIPEEGDDFRFSSGRFSYARDLVSFIKKQGSFCIGVAVYPEGHIEASSFEEDMRYTKEKIDAGADFAVTQMFFDNTYYYRLLDRMSEKAMNIPVLPGILPLTNVVKVKEFASICRTTIPRGIEEKMTSYMEKPAEMKKLGIDFTIKQCRELMKNGVKRFHFFTLNQPEVITSILEAL